MNEWLGEKTQQIRFQSVPHNITSEMGLALLDVADVIRPYPEVIDYLQHVKDDNFWMNWLSLMAEAKPETRSMIISANTECDVPEKLILQELDGAKNQLHLSQ